MSKRDYLRPVMPKELMDELLALKPAGGPVWRKVAALLEYAKGVGVAPKS